MSRTLQSATNTVMSAVLQLPSNAAHVDRIHQAIRSAGNEFVRKTGCVRSYEDVTATEGESDLTFTADGFIPRRMVSAQVVIDDVALPFMSMPNLSYIQRKLRDCEQTGIPTHIAFRKADTAVLYPIPDDEYAIRMIWTEPFTEFEPGTIDPGSVTLNIPDDMIDGVLWHGVPCYYNRGSEQAQFVNEARRQFDRHIRECMGMVSDMTSSGVIYTESDD